MAEPWRVRVWLKPRRDPSGAIVQPGSWKLVGKVDSTAEAKQAVMEIVQETGSVAKATRKAPVGEPIEIYARRSSRSVKRFVLADDAEPGPIDAEPSEGS